MQGATDREWVALQHTDETTKYTLDYSDHESVRVDGDTIASVSIDPQGVSVDDTNPTPASNAVTIKVTGTGGHIEATATTTTSSEVIVRKVHFRAPSEIDRDDDYGGCW